jgi:transposase
MHYVGLDVHQNRSSMCILDGNGRCVKRLEVKGPWATLLEQIDRHVPRPFAVCYEASCGYGHLYDRLARLAERVTVAHPGQLRLIFRSKKKHDRVDADRLAKLLYLGEVPAVHVPAVDVRAWRGLVEFRRRLVDRRVAVKNQVRALLRGLGIAPPRSPWSKKGVAWLREQALGEPDALRRDVLVDELDGLNRQVRRVEARLGEIADAHPGVKLLMTIPGVGVRTAEAFVAYVDRVDRFARSNRVGSYFGLVPCQDSSAGVERFGHVTRDGPGTVRKLLGESAWQCVRRSGAMRAWFERVARDDPGRRKIAVVAVAHRLCRVMAAMLRTGEAWREGAAAAASPPEDRMA